jgi:hypothetical protein
MHDDADRPLLHDHGFGSRANGVRSGTHWCASCAQRFQVGPETSRELGAQFPAARYSSMIAAETRPRAEIS